MLRQHAFSKSPHSTYRKSVRIGTRAPCEGLNRGRRARAITKKYYVIFLNVRSGKPGSLSQARVHKLGTVSLLGLPSRMLQMIALADVKTALERIRPSIYLSPCTLSATFSQLTGNSVYLWAVVIRAISVPGIVIMGIFLVVLMFGEFYAWRKGDLRWH